MAKIENIIEPSGHTVKGKRISPFNTAPSYAQERNVGTKNFISHLLKY